MVKKVGFLTMYLTSTHPDIFPKMGALSIVICGGAVTRSEETGKKKELAEKEEIDNISSCLGKL
jgi:hypothetical protein